MIDTKYGAVVQLGERFPCTEEVAGSTPVSSTIAVVAQLVEQLICNQQVTGSNPVNGSYNQKKGR